jgi:hypothetical protein
MGSPEEIATVTTLERRNGPIRGRFFKAFSEGLLAVVVKHAGANRFPNTANTAS